MGTEQLYFIIGFLLGSILCGCLIGIIWTVWYEWYRKQDDES